VATEQGIAPCFGHPTKQQAANIIRYAAHPDAKEELSKAAADMNLL
jgi:acyl-CoA hydrolase